MNKNINLLPLELRQKRTGKIQEGIIKILSFTIIIVVLLGGLSYFGLIKSLEYRLGRIEEEFSILKPKLEQVKFYQNENEKMQAEIKDTESIERAKVHWSMILGLINDQLPKDLWITHFSFDQNRTISLMGIAANLSPVGVFLYKLNDLTCFDTIYLEKAAEIKQGDLSLTEFTLKGTLAKGSV
ncbi:MAG: PilN domain-containing protein [Bacillota bacterium]|jgi:Tfp pilus assembly protein PilN|nr:PilN domain-containing protein [Clostridia bacterium]